MLYEIEGGLPIRVLRAALGKEKKSLRTGVHGTATKRSVGRRRRKKKKKTQKKSRRMVFEKEITSELSAVLGDYEENAPGAGGAVGC